MKQSEAKKHNKVYSVLHLNLLLTFVLRLEEQVKHHLSVSSAYGSGVSDEWIRGSEMSISSAVSRIDTVISETTDLRQKLVDHDKRLALLEGRVRSCGDLPVATRHTSLQPLNLPGDISRRLINVENGSDNIEFLIGETGRELNNIQQEVK